MIPIKKINCPKCGRIPYLLQELWTGHSIEFLIDSEGREEEGILCEGCPQSVVAWCNCGHKWTLRKITQIIDLDL